MKRNKPVHNIAYHFVWCPKYRRPLLEGQVYNRCKELIKEKCDFLGIEINNLEVMPDHIHLFVKCPSTMSPQKIMAQIKGYLSKYLRQDFKHLRTRVPTLWTKSYYCESVGSVSQEAIEKYIQNQKNV